MKNKEIGGLKFTINLITEEAKDKKGKIIYDESKEGKKDATYSRHDALSILNLLTSYESKNGTWKQYKTCLKLRDKVEKVWRDDEMKLELSLDEGNFLKEYCESLFDEKKKPEEKNNIPLFLGKTIVSILEQLE